ncbi:MAG: (d)CMP kinase [Kiritimatiellae bacterium]|nr:(d)CMP kinase [Kiritimatiellia bacterium]
MSSERQTVVAIDGPSASGKSTVSRRVAEEMGFVYVDSGALYRGMTWKVLREGVSVKDTERVVALMTMTEWEFFVQQLVVRFTVDGDDPWDQLRSAPVREAVSDVAAIPAVRTFLSAHLRSMTRFGPIVMEGRDIGSVVFPDARHKFYLDADPEERAKRRYKELAGVETTADVGEVMDSLRRRDRKDATRATAPLQIALGAQVINSTGMSVEEVVGLIVARLRADGAGA